MKRPFAALALALVAAIALIGGPAIAQDSGERVSFCHVPPGNPSNAKFHEDQPIEAWENGHEGGNGAHSEDFLTDSEEECEGGGGDGDGDDDDDDDDDKDKDKDKDKDNDGSLASTGV